MGITLFTGTVISRKLGYVKVLRDGRNDGGYDYIKCIDAAKDLKTGNRFSLYLSVLSYKKCRGKDIFIFGEPTLTLNPKDTYKLEFTTEEMHLIYTIIRASIEKQKNNQPYLGYIYNSDEKAKTEYMMLKVIYDRISNKIFR